MSFQTNKCQLWLVVQIHINILLQSFDTAHGHAINLGLLISLPASATIILECQIFVWDAWVWFLHLLPEYKDWIIFYINLSSEFSFHCIHMSFIMEETILNICLLEVIRSNKKPSLHVHAIFTMEKQQEAFFLINPCK